eukprot:GHVP01042938.1.p1 GENE.GHVP01042938.1~~GHVP01042938.1.p1  ORF type:complete len:466 (+),score=88.79 GHVP01042938.1:204-1601(+)
MFYHTSNENKNLTTHDFLSKSFSSDLKTLDNTIYSIKTLHNSLFEALTNRLKDITTPSLIDAPSIDINLKNYEQQGETKDYTDRTLKDISLYFHKVQSSLLSKMRSHFIKRTFKTFISVPAFSNPPECIKIKMLRAKLLILGYQTKTKKFIDIKIDIDLKLKEIPRNNNSGILFNNLLFTNLKFNLINMKKSIKALDSLEIDKKTINESLNLNNQSFNNSKSIIYDQNIIQMFSMTNQNISKLFSNISNLLLRSTYKIYFNLILKYRLIAESFNSFILPNKEIINHNEYLITKLESYYDYSNNLDSLKELSSFIKIPKIECIEKEYYSLWESTNQSSMSRSFLWNVLKPSLDYTEKKTNPELIVCGLTEELKEFMNSFMDISINLENQSSEIIKVVDDNIEKNRINIEIGMIFDNNLNEMKYLRRNKDNLNKKEMNIENDKMKSELILRDTMNESLKVKQKNVGN